jgi:hypothetical protein
VTLLRAVRLAARIPIVHALAPGINMALDQGFTMLHGGGGAVRVLFHNAAWQSARVRHTAALRAGMIQPV